MNQNQSFRDLMKKRMDLFLKNTGITIRKKSPPPSHQVPPTIDDVDLRADPLLIENITTLDKRISHTERILDELHTEVHSIHRDINTLRDKFLHTDNALAEVNSRLQTVIHSIGVIDME